MKLPFLLASFLAVSAVAASAQVNQDDRFEILRVLIADHAAARIVMPLGPDGVRLTETGVIDEDALAEELADEGRAISPGQVVEITDIAFGDETIEVELDDGGTRKESFLDRLQVGIGASTNPVRPRAERPQPIGSKVVLRFGERVPETMTVDELRAFLSPVLDFNRQSFMDSGVESLPLEFQEAVREKRVMIGMDQSTVTLARGRPDSKSWETQDGIEQEIWMYDKVGFGADFLTFEDGVLVQIRER